MINSKSIPTPEVAHKQMDQWLNWLLSRPSIAVRSVDNDSDDELRMKQYAADLLAWKLAEPKQDATANLSFAITCPITQENIRHLGITSLGTAYEYEEISIWLADPSHNRDPTTNEYLPDKFITRIASDKCPNEAALGRLRADRLATTRARFPAYEILQKAREKILPWVRRVQSQEWGDSWNTFNTIARIHIHILDHVELRRRLMGRGEFGGRMVYEQAMGRPTGDTGTEYEFTNLSDMDITGRDLNTCLFNGARLCNTRFTNCNLARTQWIGADLTGARFLRCGLSSACFFGATGRPFFESCRISTYGYLQGTEALEAMGLD